MQIALPCSGQSMMPLNFHRAMVVTKTLAADTACRRLPCCQPCRWRSSCGRSAAGRPADAAAQVRSLQSFCSMHFSLLQHTLPSCHHYNVCWRHSSDLPSCMHAIRLTASACVQKKQSHIFCSRCCAEPAAPPSAAEDVLSDALLPAGPGSVTSSNSDASGDDTDVFFSDDAPTAAPSTAAPSVISEDQVQIVV